MKARLVLDTLSRWLCVLACIAIAIMMVLMVVDAISRKIFGSIPGGYNTTLALLTMVLFFPQGYVQMRRTHITIDLVTSKLNIRTQAILKLVTTILAIFVFAVLAWAGGQKALDATLTKEEWMGTIFYPVWPFRWTIPIGLGMFTLQLILTAIDELRTMLKGA